MPFLLVRGLCQELWHSNDQQLSDTGQLAWILLKKKYPGYYFNDLKKISKEYVKIEKDDPENNIWIIHLWWDVFYHKWMHNFASFIIYIYMHLSFIYLFYFKVSQFHAHHKRHHRRLFCLTTKYLLFWQVSVLQHSDRENVWRLVMAMQMICLWVSKLEMTVDNHRAQCQYCTTDWDSHL